MKFPVSNLVSQKTLSPNLTIVDRNKPIKSLEYQHSIGYRDTFESVQYKKIRSCLKGKMALYKMEGLPRPATMVGDRYKQVGTTVALV